MKKVWLGAAVVVLIVAWLPGPVRADGWTWRRVMKLGDRIMVTLPPGPYLATIKPGPGADCVNVHFRFEDAEGEPVRGFRGMPCRGRRRRGRIEARPRGKLIRQVMIECSLGPAEATLKVDRPRPDEGGDDR